MRSKFKWIFTLLIAFMVQFSFAQQKTVTGTVISDGLTLPGASVKIKGTQQGTVTDGAGKFSIKAKEGDVLVVSFTGKPEQSATVGASNIINFTLSGDVKVEEVVVIGYGQRKEKNQITGNVVKLANQDLVKSPFVSVDQAMQGKVAGLSISTTAGTPGSTQDVRIRGIQSINASNSPLYVIDGVAVDNANMSGSSNISSLTVLASLNSQDIESMTVLKDAAATSIYGARGTNGVIIINTKRGKSGKAQYALRTSVGFINNASKGLVPLTGEQKQFLYEEGIYNRFRTTIGARSNTYNFIAANPTLVGAADLINWVNAGKPVNNWDELVQNKNAITRDINFSASSGNEKNRLYASLGTNYTENTVIGSDFKRISGVVNYTSDLSDKVKLNLTFNGSNVEQNGVLEQAAYFSNPNLTRYFMSPWVSPYNADGSYNLSFASPHNTLFTATNNVRKNEVLRAIQNTKLEYSILKNLKFTSTFGIDYILSSYKSYASPLHGDGLGVNGYIEQSTNRTFNYVTVNALDYNFKIANKHKIALSALHEYTQNRDNYMYGYGENLADAFTQSLANASANFEANGQYFDSATKAIAGVLNYNYDNKYLLDFTYRYEGNSRFSPAKRYGSFYAVGLAWNLHEENFMKNLTFINQLRLRGSKGITGNAGIGLNRYQSTLAYSQQYGQNPASFPSSYGGNFGWERAIKNDLGLEFGLFNNRISGSFAYFNNETYDMLLDVPLTYTSGFTTFLDNVGKMSNKGIEVQLNADVLKVNNFSWSVSANYTSLKNTVTDMPANAPTITSGTRKTEEGYMVNEWFLPTWAGVNPANGDPLWYINGVDGATTNVYANAQRVYQGASAMPTYYGGLTNTFNYKNFFVEGSLYFSGGNKVYEDWASYTQTSRTDRLGSFTATTALLDGVWLKPGDNATHPRMDYGNTIINNATSASTRFLYDGDFIRLRDVAFGYNFKANQLKGTGLTGLQFSVRGTNLLTWVKDDRLKYDPEVDAAGFTKLITPPTKTVMFQLNINF